MKKKIIAALLAAIIAVSFASCGIVRITPTETSGTVHNSDTSLTKSDMIKIPDISGLKEDEGALILSGKGLIPKRKYRYHDSVERGKIIGTEPAIGSGVDGDAPVTILVSMGPEIFDLKNAVGYIMNVAGVDPFSWGDNGDKRTKSFDMIVIKNELCIIITLGMKSAEELEFFRTFGYASVNEDYSDSVIADIEYSSKTIDNTGNDTTFTVKVPLSELENDRPKSIYIKLDFSVGGNPETLEAGFDLSW